MEADLTFVALILGTLLDFTLGSVVLFAARKEKNRSNLFFGLFAFSLGIWTLTIMGYRTAEQPQVLLFWMKAAYISALFIGLSFFYFGRIFPLGQRISRIDYIAHFSFTILFSFLIGFTNFLVQGLRQEDWGTAANISSTGWLLYAICFLAYFLSAHFYLFTKYLRTQGLLKKQLIFTFLGVFFGGEIFGVFFNLLLPSPFFNEWRHIWIGPTLTALIVVPTIAYAIVKYQLLDIKIVTAQILVVATTILSFVDMLFFKTFGEFVLRFCIFALISAFGFFLIKSVTSVIRKREKIESLNQQLHEATKQLQIKNEELKGLDKMKSEFISVASHQLRTPLTATKWALEFLATGEKGKLSKDQKETIGELQIENGKLVKLVNELLNVSRLEEKRVGIDPKPCDFVALVKDIVHEFHPIAEHKKLKVIEQYDTLPLINLDAGVIAKAIHNIISNGIKYNRDGKKLTITIKKQNTDAALTVKDEGIGIPKAEQDKLFQKFFRASNAASSNTEGSGLGLYIVKSAIELCGGTVRFESVENKGTTFFVTLPLAGCTAIQGEKSLA
ncbi:MAG: ATP-binding protein [Patescibacteria group bacterium]